MKLVLALTKFVRDFIVNLSSEYNSEGSGEFIKVYVRGKCVNFSPGIINEFLKRNSSARTDKVSLDKIAKEITGGQVQIWPKQGLLASMKFKC